MAKEIDVYQISLKAILRNRDGKVLILKVPSTWGAFVGFYDLPGGRVDEDEFTVPFSEVLMREIQEEVGNIEVKLGDAPVAAGRHSLPAEQMKTEKDIHILYVFYEAEMVSGEIEVGDEHAGFEWVDLTEIVLEKYFFSGILEGMQMYLEAQNNKK
ncbi:MAG: NUDIX domain-containing protein [Candidatus Moranbacteria bacterium]|nr:NUDIX domain-containing protein [Candidatus Moranbacteria bacterium]